MTTRMNQVRAIVAKRIKMIWEDESAQGTLEYVLIIAVVVAAAAIFRKQIQAFVKDRLENIGGALGAFNAAENN